MEMKKWTDIELELSRKHEDLILRREVLLRGSECYYANQEKRAASFIADMGHAEQRNMQLLQDLNETISRIQQHQDIVSPRFDTLRKNYWSMVRSVFPVWYDQHDKETSQMRPKHGISAGPRQSPLPGGHRQSPVPAGHRQSPPSSRRSNTPHDRQRPIKQSEDDRTTTDVPPLDLDFSIGEDITSQNITPKGATMETNSSLGTTDKQARREKRVLFDEAQLSAAAKKSSGRTKSKSKKSHET